MTDINSPKYFSMEPTVKAKPFKRKQKLPGRNDLCFCGSKKKFKNCHEVRSRLELQRRVIQYRAEQVKKKENSKKTKA
jgi:hypothetical protein